jgi:hypothetical protein
MNYQSRYSEKCEPETEKKLFQFLHQPRHVDAQRPHGHDTFVISVHITRRKTDTDIPV